MAAGAVLAAALALVAPATAAERPGSLPHLRDRALAVGFLLTGGGDRPFPAAATIRRQTGFGVSPNAYRCPARLGGLTFFRQQGGLGLTLLWRGRRHVARVDLGPQGQLLGALRLPCPKKRTR